MSDDEIAFALRSAIPPHTSTTIITSVEDSSLASGSALANASEQGRVQHPPPPSSILEVMGQPLGDAMREMIAANFRIRLLQQQVNRVDPESVKSEEVTLHQRKISDFRLLLSDLQSVVYRNCPTEQDIVNNTQPFLDAESHLDHMELALGKMERKNNTKIQSTTPHRVPLPQVKLPKIDLPIFDGRYEDWPSFRDLFTATVITNTSLSGAQQLQYLKSCLKGETERQVKSFTVTDDHFAEAWSLVCHRYDNTREIVFGLLKKILHAKALTSESYQQLQRLLDIFMESVRALKVLKRPVERWDDFLVFLLLEKLDPETRKEFSREFKGTSVPKFEETMEFLETRVRSLQICARGQGQSTISETKTRVHQSQGSIYPTSTTSASRSKCALCQGERHPLYKCERFISLAPDARKAHAIKSNACFGCLSLRHGVKNCESSGSCRSCGGKHHSLLHTEQQQQYHRTSQQVRGNSRTYNTVPPPPISTNFTTAGAQGLAGPSILQEQVQNSANIHSVSTPASFMPVTRALFSTAVVKALNSYNTYSFIRVFLDSGAGAHIISESCIRRLGLQRSRSEPLIYGVGDTCVGQSRGRTTVTLQSRISNYQFTVSAMVMAKVTAPQPEYKLQPNDWNHLKGLALADPNYQEPSEIDMILGVESFFSLVTGEIIHGPPNQPSALNTRLGWIIGGSIPSSNSQIHLIRVHQVALEETSSLVKRFWELEEVPKVIQLSKEEKEAESHFLTTHSRDELGRYVTHLPFNSKFLGLGASREIAYHRLLSTERRLKKNSEWKVNYIDFMRNYLSLGHMSLLPLNRSREVVGSSNYLPHHFVLKESSSTTKFRVVFDGSAQTSTGISLNSTLIIGPKVQRDLFDILLSFRVFAVALKADITKMYRQFKIPLPDQDFLRILWREESNKPIRDYVLNTVTYGTASAPHTATRCLAQLAQDEGLQFPLAAKILKNHFYVDDLMCSFSEISEAAEASRQLTGLLATAQLELRKWDSNSQEALDGIPRSSREFNEDITSEHSLSSKVLGVAWDSKEDCFGFNGFCPKKHGSVTKRVVLSEMARLFDPLGFLAPLTVRVKLFFQKLWTPVTTGNGVELLDWDDPIPESLMSSWEEFNVGLARISKVKVPRCLIPSGTIGYELHGFSDASELAYSAVVYIRTIGQDSISTQLVAAKTKVAPVRHVSIPRLELCGALLLTRLLEAVVIATELDCPAHAWTDSECVLKWLSSYSRRWQTFVANRVAIIQETLPSESWKYVPSKDNPADCASRGLSLNELLSHPLWWNGPEWLLWETIPCFGTSKVPLSPELLEEKVKMHLAQNPMHMRRSGPLTHVEIRAALSLAVHWAQRESIVEETRQLQHDKRLRHSSNLLSLNPFLGKDGLIRVGGRLQRSGEIEDTCHQVILPPRHHLTRLIILEKHIRLLHAGLSLLWTSLRREFWIPRGRNIIRGIIRRCVKCQRMRADRMEQLMGSLPTGRVTPSRPFTNVGVDFAGPFLLHSTRGRGKKPFKGYLCLFVCFSSKAIHLEPVTDLSAEAFLATLKRFAARRGVPVHVHSDNGTNFVGAERELREFITAAKTEEAHRHYSDHGISWHFNPPSTPHQGGLWEAGVKSVKYHLRRVMGNTILTLEEFWTLLCQIEAALNSRPLCALTDDPEDYNVLTPGHFLIGQPLTALPDVDVTDLRVNRLSYWQHVSHMFQHFWKRWSMEYLTSLQQRFKWTQKTDNVRIGQLVLVRDEQLSPLKWKMARVTEIHPGPDGLVRVVSLKTSTGSYQRPLVKLCPLILTEE